MISHADLVSVSLNIWQIGSSSKISIHYPSPPTDFFFLTQDYFSRNFLKNFIVCCSLENHIQVTFDLLVENVSSNNVVVKLV